MKAWNVSHAVKLVDDFDKVFVALVGADRIRVDVSEKESFVYLMYLRIIELSRDMRRILGRDKTTNFHDRV